MSRKITKNQEYVEYPKYENISFFVGLVLMPIGVENQRNFYNDFLNLLMDIGIPFDKKSFIKYAELYKKVNKDKNLADELFKKYIYGGEV